MNKQIIHIIKNKAGDFRYHFLKGMLLKDSKVSNAVHPLHEVNILREQLIKNKKIKKIKSGYIVKDSFKVGFLMSYNLHSGELRKEIKDYASDIRLFKLTPEIDSLIKGEFISSDNQNYIELSKYSQKLEKVWFFNLNYKFIEGTHSDEFSKIEDYIAKLLNKHKYISDEYRHGIALNKECDIVDEGTNSQIEITFSFKTTLKKKKKTPYKDAERILTELSDNSFIHPSESLIGKMSKEYTDKYKKYLAIVMIGTPESSFTLFERLIDKLITGDKEISPFQGYYLIVYEPIEKYIYLTFTENQSELTEYDCSDFDFLKIEETSLDRLDDSSKYLFMLSEIFTEKKALMIFDKADYHDYAKKLKIYNQ